MNRENIVQMNTGLNQALVPILTSVALHYCIRHFPWFTFTAHKNMDGEANIS